MSLRPLDLTTALRPSLLPDETLLFVQDAIGLYAGKSKLAEYQNGQAYLTSHRACYVDNAQPRQRAVALDLKDIERCEISAGFLKSSPKVTLFPKGPRLGAFSSHNAGTPFSQAGSNGSRTSTPTLSSRATPQPTPVNATWICSICSFSNTVPVGFDPVTANTNTPLPPCLACGVKPTLANLIRASVSSMAGRQPGLLSGEATGNDQTVTKPSATTGKQCPRCTYLNHPSLLSCETCGNSLVMQSAGLDQPGPRVEPSKTPSPAPQVDGILPNADNTEGIKFSFRAGGEKIFHERLRGALTQRKWILRNAPSNTSAEQSFGLNGAQAKDRSNIGIAGLERRGIELRKNNEVVIGNAFEDLAALMASAKEIIALAEEFASQAPSEALGAVSSSGDPSGDIVSADPTTLLSQLNLTTTKDMLSNQNSNNLYLTELSRSLAEFLTDDVRGLLRSAGGVMSLGDVWAAFNRARGGVELVSPVDFTAAAELFDRLRLPVRLRRFRSGLLVVQERSRTDEKTVTALLSWLQDLRASAPEGEVSWDWSIWGQGVTAQETAERFGWSIGVANEELEMAEERNALCREAALEGTRFWENWLVVQDGPATLNVRTV